MKRFAQRPQSRSAVRQGGEACSPHHFGLAAVCHRRGGSGPRYGMANASLGCRMGKRHHVPEQGEVTGQDLRRRGLRMG